ncbi:hypothetical protein P8452_52673 [Trifolium repens]|nr:hypothetical protein P8452_52673 [Trifolium repens]
MEIAEVQVEKIPEEEYFEKMKVVYPRAEEDLIDFLNRCKLENKGVMLQIDRRPTFRPSGSIPVERWMHQGTIKFNKGAMEVGGFSGTKLSYSEDVNKYSYRNNYKGKHLMTRTQWRRFQR